MTVRRILLPTSVVLLACSGVTSDPEAVGKAVDEAHGPAFVRLGSEVIVESSHTHITSWGRGISHSVPASLGPVTDPDPTLHVDDGVVQAVTFSAPTPGSDGNRDCYAVRDEVEERYGAPTWATRGLFLYPEAKWTGRQVEVWWQRTGELFTDRYVCKVHWYLR